MSAYNPYGTAFRYCKCGNPLTMLDHDGDRAWYSKKCSLCEDASLARIDFAKEKIAVLQDETECFRVMSAILTRMEAIRGDQNLKRSGYVAQ